MILYMYHNKNTYFLFLNTYHELFLLTNCWHQMCEFFPPPNNQFSDSLDTVYPKIHFNSDINYLELVQSPQVKGSVP